MKNKVINFLKRIFGRIASRPENKAVPVAAASEVRTAGQPPCVVRGRRVLSKSGMRQRQGCVSGVWCIKADGFSDAYRLLLRLGRQDRLVCIKRAGHVRYRLDLPDGNGSITLSDRVGNRRGTLAVMLFNVPEIPEIREIRFLGSLD